MKSFILKSFVLLLFCIFGIASIVGIDKTLAYEKDEPNLLEEIKAKSLDGYLDREILKAIKKENFDDVQMYQNIADLSGVTLEEYTLAQIESHNNIMEKSWRNTKEFTLGFISGEAKSVVGMSGSVVSDLTVYGDLRDLKTEGTKYKNKEPYDEFLLDLSLVGVALSASQLLSVGVTTPLKVGASAIKLAHKAGTLTKPFVKTISNRLKQSVDVKILKKLEFSIFHIGDTTQAISKSIHIKPIRGLFTDINKIQKNSSITDTITLLKYVDNGKELKKMAKVTKQFKGNTRGILTVLGKSALRSGKIVIKYSAELIAMIVSFLFSMAGFLATVSMRSFFTLPKRQSIKAVVKKEVEIKEI